MLRRGTGHVKAHHYYEQTKMFQIDSSKEDAASGFTNCLAALPSGEKAGSSGESSPYQEGRGWCLVSTSRICLAFACQLLSLELSMHAVSRTCRLHHKSPGFFCFESLRSTRAPGRQPCAETRREESQVPEAAPRCKGATRPPGAKDPAMLKGHAPFFDGSWHGLSNKCV